MNQPKINDLIEEALQDQYSHGEEVVRQLTGGVSALPDEIEYGAVKPKTIKQIKKDVGNLITPNIGRIDAIAVEF